ncbi:uncharacterized protein BDZ99DRAFT_67039 [Mytilinidion resinicola]|uniref:Uncharacterized protein n=1 Tax=Mytilinidion resinicola TaxID=574789 RepID=A0A6A6YGB2_9PEZI|nr:uncharacterized protein BDZ99DRAFT_67039 [Mytilinidion resinicola]KAF2807842.1 hypothetical protein BDZ99DRAFT_67039 [Mytilinidion resinicola]
MVRVRLCCMRHRFAVTSACSVWTLDLVIGNPPPPPSSASPGIRITLSYSPTSTFTRSKILSKIPKLLNHVLNSLNQHIPSAQMVGPSTLNHTPVLKSQLLKAFSMVSLAFYKPASASSFANRQLESKTHLSKNFEILSYPPTPISRHFFFCKGMYLHVELWVLVPCGVSLYSALVGSIDRRTEDEDAEGEDRRSEDEDHEVEA